MGLMMFNHISLSYAPICVRNLNYFEENEERMHYDQYRAMHLPIGSGTVESSCKKVIGGRMKQGGMSW